MDYIDLVIIYLACGAPFGVYELTITRRGRNVALHGVSAILFWPAYTVRHLNAFFDPDTRLRHEARRIRIGLEEAAMSNASSSEVFEFRQVYEQLTGLAAARAERAGTHDLFAATGHPDPDLASICLARRNRIRIDFHLERSKQDLLRLIDKFRAKRSKTVEDLLDELGSAIGSPDLARERLAAEVVADAADGRADVVPAIDRF